MRYVSKFRALVWSSMRENLTLLHVSDEGTDQPAHPRSLINAFVIRLFKSILSMLTTGEISILYLVSVAEQAVLVMTWSETPEDRFSHVVDQSGSKRTHSESAWFSDI